MKSGLDLPIYTFNSGGNDGVGGGDYKFYFDNSGNIINRDKRVFGVYNKIIRIEYGKFWYITKNYIGLGDIIDFFTKTFYIKQFLVWITNGNCGCETRRILFNKWVQIPYFKLNSRPLYADDDDILLELKLARKKKIKFVSLDKKKSEIKKFIGYSDTIRQNMEQEKEKNINVVESTKQNLPKPQPVKPENIKGGCGCSKNKK